MATRVQNKVDALPEGFAEKDQEDVKDFRTFIHFRGGVFWCDVTDVTVTKSLDVTCTLHHQFHRFIKLFTKKSNLKQASNIKFLMSRW